MSRSKDKGRLAPFVPVDLEMMACAAWRKASPGARCLYIHLKRRYSHKHRNNGRIFLSHRDANKEMGSCPDSIGRWYRELQHYGFIVMTTPGCLGVSGEGMAPHWRLTEHEGPGGRNGDTWSLPTKDYLKWDGVRFQDSRGAVRRQRTKKQKPAPHIQGGVSRICSAGPPHIYGTVPAESALHMQYIGRGRGALYMQDITRLTTPPPYSGVGRLRYTLSEEYRPQNAP